MKLIHGLTLIALSAIALARVQKIHASRHHGKPAAKPEAVQTWEGEGGGLPTGGPGPGVKVALAATPDPDLEHHPVNRPATSES
jgi:hypothetical protein